jgi:hypothetical protein
LLILFLLKTLSIVLLYVQELANLSSSVTIQIQCWICTVLWWPFWKWRPVEIFRCWESFRDIIIYPHMKCRWNRTMLNLYFQNGHHKTAQIQHCLISTPFHMWVDYDVPNWFLTSKNFYQSPFSKWPPQSLKSDNVEFVWYCGGHFENGDR